jgi:hypothetical protein
LDVFGRRIWSERIRSCISGIASLATAMSASSTSAKKSTAPGTNDEVEKLRAELRGMEVLLLQNAALEKEVERLNSELDEATFGVQKKGYLYKWREREIYYAAKWGLRYFMLQGSKISYYGNDHDNRPRRTIDLTNCYVRDEGKKKGYHIFSIYLGKTTASEADNPLDSSLLLRMSAESSAEALQWIDMLEQGCALNDGSFPPLNSPSPSFVHYEPTPAGGSLSTASPSRSSSPLKSPGTRRQESGDDWGQHVIRSTDDLTALPQQDVSTMDSSQISSGTLERVRSSSRVLQKSLSRQTLARRVMTNRLPHNVSDGQVSPARDSTPKRTRGKGIHKTFPPFKPMHVQSQTSPLSPDVSKVDINFRGFFNLGVIILLITHFEMILNNGMKYGFKASVPFLVVSFSHSAMHFVWTPAHVASLQWVLAVAVSWVTPVVLSFLVESAAAKFRINERLILGVNSLLGTANIVIPCAIVWFSHAAPGANMLYLLQAVIIWMKLISYAHANRGLRRSSRKVKKDDKDDSANSNGNAVKGKQLCCVFSASIVGLRVLSPQFWELFMTKARCELSWDISRSANFCDIVLPWLVFVSQHKRVWAAASPPTTTSTPTTTPSPRATRCSFSWPSARICSRRSCCTRRTSPSPTWRGLWSPRRCATSSITHASPRSAGPR